MTQMRGATSLRLSLAALSRVWVEETPPLVVMTPAFFFVAVQASPVSLPLLRRPSHRGRAWYFRFCP